MKVYDDGVNLVQATQYMEDNGFYLVTNPSQQRIADFMCISAGWFSVADTPGLSDAEKKRATHFYITHRIPNKHHLPVSVWDCIIAWG